MIARVTWGKIKPDHWDKYEALWNDYAKDSDAAGCRGRILLRDDETADAGFSISFWDAAADFDKFHATMRDPGAMRDCFVGQYVTTITMVNGSTLAGLTRG